MNKQFGANFIFGTYPKHTEQSLGAKFGPSGGNLIQKNHSVDQGSQTPKSSSQVQKDTDTAPKAPVLDTHGMTLPKYQNLFKCEEPSLEAPGNGSKQPFDMILSELIEAEGLGSDLVKNEKSD